MIKKFIVRIENSVFCRLRSRGFFNRMSDKAYLKMLWRRNFHKKLDLNAPKTFNEKLQWLKLYNRKPEYTAMVDKYEVKKLVADKIGEEYVIPTLGVWNSFDEIDFDKLPDQFVLKCTHDSGGLVICRNKKSLDKGKARKKIDASLKRNYYWSCREWPYKDVKPRIIAEEYINTKGDRDDEPCDAIQAKFGLLDYKFMCFDGQVRACFLDIGVIGEGSGHAEEYYRNIYDRSGNLLDVRETRENYPESFDLPSDYEKMVEIAETLSEGIPHVRVDLYRLSSNEIKFGELTFFHGSGLSNEFIPNEWDYTFGEWIELPKSNHSL